jgi:integrase
MLGALADCPIGSNAAGAGHSCASYRLHDARHHWAVRMARASDPFELIARQLGHRDVAKVYGRFKPNTEERDRWERIAVAGDEEKWPRSGAKGGATTRENR